jgi:hypothetical protein
MWKEEVESESLLQFEVEVNPTMPRQFQQATTCKKRLQICFAFAL